MYVLVCIGWLAAGLVQSVCISAYGVQHVHCVHCVTSPASLMYIDA
jgi:hypothetical protein